MKKFLFFFLCCSCSFLHSAIIQKDIPIGFSYEDVLLVPTHSPIKSRREVDCSTQLTRNIRLHIPLVSSNMDTVTEDAMAIALAKEGGIGIIHRFNHIFKQANLVRKVKRHQNAIIKNPITINVNASTKNARNIMKIHGISGLLVVTDNNQLCGILTKRDISFDQPDDTPIIDLMTKPDKLLIGLHTTTVEQAKKILQIKRLEKLPLVNPDKTIAGLITQRDICEQTNHPYMSLDKKGSLLVGAAVGVKEDSLKRAKQLVKAGVDVLVVDIAHGDSSLAVTMVQQLKSNFPDIEVIAGNVATPQGVQALIKAGADAVKVGVGPGSICTTRIITGCGYPQLSAIIACAQEAEKHGVPIIADGGIRTSGDIVKAIAGGASTVMLGNMLAGTYESPGKKLVQNGKQYKIIRGMACLEAKLQQDCFKSSDQETEEPFDFVAEGVEGLVPYRGEVSSIVKQILGGLRSGMSYCGARTISELRCYGTFVQITASGQRESNYHDIITT